MNIFVLAIFSGIFIVPSVNAQEHAFPELAQRVPYFTQRLHSTRFQVRYALLGELNRRDVETKQALETLVRDENQNVANQALVRYLRNFVNIDKSHFKPDVYLPRRYPVAIMLENGGSEALVEYCLGRREIEKVNGWGDDTQPPLPVLEVAQLDNPRINESITIVGILGKPGDAPALYPFLDSSNDYVALGAAKAVVRLGETEKGVETLLRLAKQDPTEHLHNVTDALYVLNELDHPELRAMIAEVLSSVDQTGQIQPGWLDGFLLLAADVTGEDVWNSKEPQAEEDENAGR